MTLMAKIHIQCLENRYSNIWTTSVLDIFDSAHIFYGAKFKYILERKVLIGFL